MNKHGKRKRNQRLIRGGGSHVWCCCLEERKPHVRYLIKQQIIRGCRMASVSNHSQDARTAYRKQHAHSSASTAAAGVRQTAWVKDR